MLSDQAFAFARGLQYCRRVGEECEQCCGGPLGVGGIPGDKALAAPLPGGDAPLERSRDSIRINHYESVLRRLRAVASWEMAGEVLPLRGVT